VELSAADSDCADRVVRLLYEVRAGGVQAIQAGDSGAVADGDVHMPGTYVAGRDLHVGSDG
jgi:hypothetical protein